MLVYAFLFIGVGIWTVVKPSGIIGWAKHAHPQLSEGDRTVRLTARLVGTGLIILGICLSLTALK